MQQYRHAHTTNLEKPMFGKVQKKGEFFVKGNKTNNHNNSHKTKVRKR